MGIFRQYILSFISVTLLCHIVSRIIDSCAVKKSIKLLSGILILTSISVPLGDFHLESINLEDSIIADGDRISAYGVELSKKAKKDLIINECEAYILKKAESLGLDIAVDVNIDQTLIPVSVNIQGNASPHVQKTLSDIIENDLGILKENQVWVE